MPAISVKSIKLLIQFSPSTEFQRTHRTGAQATGIAEANQPLGLPASLYSK